MITFCRLLKKSDSLIQIYLDGKNIIYTEETLKKG
jgi:hypothetical protein